MTESAKSMHAITFACQRRRFFACKAPFFGPFSKIDIEFWTFVSTAQQRQLNAIP